MNKKFLFPLVVLSSLVVTGCNGSGEKEPDYTPITVMSANLDQAHQDNPTYHNKVKEAVAKVMPDLLGVQEEAAGWVDYLNSTLKDYGYTHIYETRGGGFSEASGIFVNTDRFDIKDSGTFWFGPNGGPHKSGYIATEWGASLPRVCSWAKLYDRYADKEICYFNAHLEYNHSMTDMNKDATETDNNVICRVNSINQVIEEMKKLDVPGFFTGDFNFWREKEKASYDKVLEYFDDAWALAPDAPQMCSYHNYGRELDPERRVYPYSPIDYVLSTKDDFTAREFVIYSKEGDSEEDFDSDHFFVSATFGYGLNNYGEEKKEPTSSSSTSISTSSAESKPSSPSSNPISSQSSVITSYVAPTPKDNAIKVMSVNLDQGNENSNEYHNKVMARINEANADLIGVQEENAGWESYLTAQMKTKGYTHIVKNRGGSWPEASGIFIRDSRFTIKDSGTFWFGPNGGENKPGYIAVDWGASFPRVCSWALLTDKKTNKDICYFNAHLEYDHAFGNMNGDATSSSNTKYCRQASCQQVIDNMSKLGVPGFFSGDLNSYRSLEPKVYNTCLAYFDDAWADYPLSEKMCTWNDYGNEINPATRKNPYEPIDYIYSTKGMFEVCNFTIMHNKTFNAGDFDSDHFFIHATFNYKF